MIAAQFPNQEKCMSKELTIYFSNRLEILYLNLKNALFYSNFNPFARRIIVVYGPAIQSWLMLKMAQDPDLGIAAGVEFIYLSQAFEKLLEIGQAPKNKYLPSPLELALAIEKEIYAILRAFPILNVEEKKIWQPLLDYLKLNPNHETLSPKIEKRLVALSQHLAQLFRDYGRFAGHHIAKWNESNPADWQQHLWQKLFNEKSCWHDLSKALQLPISLDSNCQIHFFSISFLARCEFEFIQKLARQVPVNYYMISPCAVFWSDIRSDKESSWLQSFWQKRLGPTSPEMNQLEELLSDRNPLLANFGRMGREMACQIEESHAQTHAHYLLPAPDQFSSEEHIGCDDLSFFETGKPLTLLQSVQTDLLLMRNAHESSSSAINESDRSIQLHGAPNRRREIEILYHLLVGLIDQNPGLEPRDIIVMTPQISDYAPYIQSQFGGQKSLIDFQILDLGMQSQNEIVQAFLQLLALSESTWNASYILELFEQPALQRRHALTQADYELIRDWIEQADIRWGDDPSHRNELLQRRHCLNNMADETAVGTWEYGLERLLTGLTCLFDEDSNPCQSIDFSDSELLGKWINLMHSLRDDLTPLHDHSRMTVDDWATYFTCLLESYLQPDFQNSQSVEDYNNLKGQFEILRNSAQTLKEVKFTFYSMKAHLDNLLQQKGITFRENYLQSVRFCSLVPLRSIPAKVIALLGMQEGAFPRSNQPSSLNLTEGKPHADYHPTAVDYDRYLFLEALHSAQDYLLISYLNYDQKDSKELQPSLIAEELFSYLDRHYTINERKISECRAYKHPMDAFDKRYFQKNSGFYNYSYDDFKAAQINLHDHKKAPHRFIEKFALADQPIQEIIPNNSQISIKQLCDLTGNPIKFHLNKVLEIYLKDAEDRSLKNEEELEISPLHKSILVKNSLKKESGEIIKQAEQDGKLPFGLYKTIAGNQLTDEIDALKERMLQENLTRSQFYQIEFCTSCKAPVQINASAWLLPAITIKYSDDYQVNIIGTIENATPKGLFAISKSGTLGEIWKIWPQYLAFIAAAKYLPEFSERNLILTGTKTVKSAFFNNPEPYFKQLIRYYALCRQNFSPLFPLWMAHLSNNDIEKLQKEINNTFDDSFSYRDKSIQWILNKDHLPNALDIIESWKDESENLLGELKRHWKL